MDGDDAVKIAVICMVLVPDELQADLYEVRETAHRKAIKRKRNHGERY